jgi:ferredoxin
MEVFLAINPRKCNAMQVCVRLMPDTFELGAAGYSRIKRSEFSREEVARLREVALGCPTQAIVIEVEDVIEDGT